MSRSNHHKVIVLTMGDPKGIGPEVTVKALRKIMNGPGPWKTRDQVRFTFIVVGDKRLLKALPKKVACIDIPYTTAGEGSLKFLDKAIELIKGGIADAMVTAPLAKEAVSHYAKNFVGHTEYLAHAFGIKNFDMMFVSPKSCLTIATRHVPLKEVPRLISKTKVFESIALMAETLKTRFKIKNPRIAVLGLNPHAGEGGLLGMEDKNQILPAILQAKSRGINAIGPFPADTFFAFPGDYDGIIAMYHDQGLAPYKGLYMKELVNFTAGLPFVRTSPAHGTAYDIAGKNKADPSSMIAAIKLACEHGL